MTPSMARAREIRAVEKIAESNASTADAIEAINRRLDEVAAGIDLILVGPRADAMPAPAIDLGPVLDRLAKIEAAVAGLAAPAVPAGPSPSAIAEGDAATVASTVAPTEDADGEGEAQADGQPSRRRGNKSS